jgi:hypothetical protein
MLAVCFLLNVVSMNSREEGLLLLLLLQRMVVVVVVVMACRCSLPG